MSVKYLRLLEPNLIPELCWEQGLSQLHKEGRCRHWPMIKESSSEIHGSLCIHCDYGFIALSCEIWQYDEPNGVIVLSDVAPMCLNCHQVIHLGRSEILAAEGVLDWKALIRHFCQVRNCKPSQFDTVAREAFDLWSFRSQKRWRVDYGKFEGYVHEPYQQPDTAALEAILPLPQTDSNRKPTETKHTKWLSVRKTTTTSAARSRLKDGDKLGCFILSASKDKIDLLWAMISKATAEGNLGSEAYVNTAFVDPKCYRPQTFVCGVVLAKGDDKERIESDLLSNLFKGQGQVYWKPQVVHELSQPKPTKIPQHYFPDEDN